MEQPKAKTAPLSLKERQRREREELILQVAEEVLLEKGYYEASIDEIAARVGIAKGTVYLHFASKEDLIFALMMREIKQVIADVEVIANSEGSAQNKLERILQSWYGNVIKRIQLFSELFHNVTPHRFKEHGKMVLETWEGASETIRNILDEGKVSGEFTEDIPTVVMISAFLGLLSPGSYVRLMLKETNIAGADLAKYFGRIYCQGIIKQEGEP